LTLLVLENCLKLLLCQNHGEALTLLVWGSFIEFSIDQNGGKALALALLVFIENFVHLKTTAKLCP